MTTLCEELEAQRPLGPVAASFGVFDGVHRGHLHVIEQLKRSAAARGLIPVVVTLSNNPLSVLRPEVPVVQITSLRERLDLLRASGVERVVPVTFTSDMSLLSAEEFMHALCDCLGLRHLLVGPDFALGHGREGTPQYMATLGADMGYTVETATPFELDGVSVRSTAIRQILAAGDIEAAAKLLGRPFALDGLVVEGEGRGGGLLGFPTANLGLDPLQALPADGVYATWITVEGVRYPSATSVGIKPTFHDEAPRVIEAFVLDFDGNLYGKHARLEFVKRLRGQERFDGVDALVAKMTQDIGETRAVLAHAPASGEA